MAVGGGAAAGGGAQSGLLKGIAVAALGGVTGLSMMTAAVIGGAGSAAASSCGPEGEGSQPYVSQKPSEKAVSDIPQAYFDLYSSAAAEFGIDKFVLAAVGKVESNHGEDILNEGSGAGGPMQFMPDTWASVGLDANGDGTADVNDPEDAIPSAAKYLRDNGAPDDYYGALYAYNNSDAYVSEVLAIADEYRAAEAPDGTIALLLDSSLAVVQAVNPFAQEVPLAAADMNGANAVDENRNMHYESNTSYGSAWSQAVSDWNAGGAVNIASSPGGDETDLWVGDGDLPGSTMGHTSVSGGDGGKGEIVFDTGIMSGATENAQNAAASHEAGHALSFEHASNSVMATPIVSASSNNIEDPTDYDWSVYDSKWGGGTPQEEEGGGNPQYEPDGGGDQPDQPSDDPSDEPPSGNMSPDTPSGGGGGDEPEGPPPTTGSEDFFQDLFGDDYEGATPTGGGQDNKQQTTKQNRQTNTKTNTVTGSGESDGPDFDDDGPVTQNGILAFGDDEGGDGGGGEDRGGKSGKKGNKNGGAENQYDTPDENQYGGSGENPNGGSGGDDGGGGESSGKAVFPLPKDYQDDFSNDWGAARSQGSHEGTDIFAPDGTPVSSITSGTVVKSGWDQLGGWTVLIKADKDIGPVRAGDQLYYAHMQEQSSLQPGQSVGVGDRVGNVGSTGEGPPGTLLPDGRGQHLHLGWYDETGNRAETASGAMNTFDLLTWLVDNGGEATGGPSAPGPCPDEAGDGGGESPRDGDSPEDGSQPGTGSSDAVVQEAEKYMGVPYVLGGPEVCRPGETMDCTCLTTTVFKEFGYTGGQELPDWPQSLYDYGEPVEGDLQAGDVVIYNDPGDGTGGHTGIAINSTEMIHACLPCGQVVIGPIFEVPNYGGARRLV